MVPTLRKRILQKAYEDGMGHIPSALSILDIVWELYDKVMTPDDQFILSKGHGVMALYAVLEAKGLLVWDTKLMGHPKRGGAILASTGSLGHGLPLAVGLAMAKKIKGEPGRVFCLIGDGECNEGTIWESAMVASHQKLDNLRVIVDYNHSGDRALNLGKDWCDEGLVSKFRAFGFQTEWALGMDELDALNYSAHSYRPLAFIYNTIKGNGVDFMVGDPSWHNKTLTEQDYENIKKEIIERA